MISFAITWGWERKETLRRGALSDTPRKPCHHHLRVVRTRDAIATLTGATTVMATMTQKMTFLVVFEAELL